MTRSEVVNAGQRDVPGEVEELRRRLAGMSGDTVSETSVLPVPDAMTPLFPRGGLSRGTVVASAGATTVPMAIIAETTRAGATVALVGLPRLNLAAAMDMGADLSRVAVVTEPGVDPLEVAGVLLDGIDLVVLGPELGHGRMRGPVAPSRARVLAGRARKQSSTLLVLGDWPGAAVRISSEVTDYQHVPARRSGYGRIGGFGVDVQVSASGARPSTGRFDLVTPGMGDEQGVLHLEAVDVDVRAPARPKLAVAN
ncbi:DNA recombination/repair protein RecA [Gordonia sp. HY285]|uniref:DNA recombination/repair protein RecA n=1 Tax=Gordonia liuliyuniae TaxID=2911517 RepID=UPI001F1C8B1B|nr:DNA recombination/repair protein RecA [Gordonia liuliyuniae]MCF8611706.1 DNA recombination/repair protein RecA [Gordonia liuliyuniae]